MAILHQVLGGPGRDNALIVRIDSGQRVSRLLFDCGEACVSGLAFSEIQSIDHLFLSHCHMDHIGGFDSFFRCNFARDARENRIWGPPGTSSIIHHRFQGFLWNLVGGTQATWYVNDIYPGETRRHRYELSEGFACQHHEGAMATSDIVVDDDDFTVSAIQLCHHGTCLGYLVREKPSVNVNKGRLAELGLRPGPWMRELKGQATGDVTIDGKTHSMEHLRAELLVESPGQSIAYLTDFLLDEATFQRLATVLHGCHVAVCEAQYRHQDLELAQRNHHTTVKQVAELATSAGLGDLILFHLSDRYTREEWAALLDEGRASFGRARFPTDWDPAVEG